MAITDNGRLSQTTPIGKVSHTGSINQKVGDTIHFAVSSCRGRRQTQEDTFVIEAELRPALDDETETLSPDLLRVLPGHALFAVFDGHGTDFASKYSASHFVSTFCKQSSFLEYSRIFRLDSPQQCNPSGKKKRQPKQYDKADSQYDVDLKSLLANAIESTMIELDANMLREITSRNNAVCGGKLDTCSRDDQTVLYDIFDSGTTAIVVLLTPQYFVCANLGDSRAILQRGSLGNISVISLSNDHKSTNDGEALRIQNAGGEVIRGLIEGRLAVSRGLGDFCFKHTPSVLRALEVTERCSDMGDYVLPQYQMVTAVPEITFHKRTISLDNFIAIACDGIWDVLSNEKCAEIISTIFHEGEQSTALVCEEVLDQCYAKGSLDNMTLILIRLPAQNIGIGGGVMKRRKQRVRNG